MNKKYLKVALMGAMTVIASGMFTSCEKDDKDVAVTDITLNKAALTLSISSSETLTATVLPTDATDKTVTWSSSDDSKATVANGVVTAVAAGSATITAKAGEKTATCVVTVVTNPLVPNTDGSATLTVIVENGNSYNSTISTAKLFIRPDGGDDVEIVSGNYANGGFTINLPATLNASLVENLEFPEAFTVSDSTAKVTGLRTSFRIYGYKDSEIVGRFYCKSGDYDVKLFYADKDVNISGQILREDRNDSIYNLSLKKGWNLVYVLETSDTYEVTTTSQGELKWTLNS
ncbi:hypothetical protein FACS1894199_10410 [Bacteroidia bacterium]|nr:hypothetical protein FACS1894199_10410 [Bacteroidia bacterium]